MTSRAAGPTPVRIDTGDVELAGDLTLPSEPRAVVAFAHGSGSSRHSPRNQALAGVLHEAGQATLLFDLLTEDEARVDAATAELRFAIPLLAGRLVAAVDHLARRDETRELPLGLFGASTGAAAALVAAAARPGEVRAVVSRGGRPDLAGEALGTVAAPVLLIVGGRDEEVLRLNEQAADALAAPYTLHVVPGASHLFAEPGTLDQAAVAARDWFAGLHRRGG